MTYKDQVIKRVQEELNNYFEGVKKQELTDIENELFIIKSFIYQRSTPPPQEEFNGKL